MTIQTSEWVFYVLLTARSIRRCGPWFKVQYERLEKPGIELMTPEWQDKKLHTTPPRHNFPIIQCTCDQQRLRHAVSALTHYIKQASWIARSKEGAYCTISEGSDQNVLLQSHCLSRFGQPIEGKYDQRMLLSECAVGRLTRVFARRTRRFVKPRDCRRYIRLAKALIRLLMCRLRVCRLIRLFVQVLL